MIKLKKKKNPYKYGLRTYNSNDLFFRHEYQYLKKFTQNLILINQGVAETYYFELDYSTDLYGHNLPKGNFIIKFDTLHSMSNWYKTKLLELSKLKLIPHIYFIDTRKKYAITVMEFLDATDLDKLLKESAEYVENKALKLYLVSKIEKELKKWHSKNYVHGDLQLKNILLKKDGSVIFIDPSIIDRNRKHDLNDILTFKEDYL